MSELRFHHLGVACRDLERESGVYAAIGYAPESGDFEDPRQGIKGRFLAGPGPRLELLVQLPGSDVLEPWLAGPARIYHQAFEVDDIESAIADLERAGARVAAPPTPAVAFEGRRIVFLLFGGMQMVELIESGGS
jgi:methylmalonyl-CoA/ethylmalonyl-CoA epimerase